MSPYYVQYLSLNRGSFSPQAGPLSTSCERPVQTLSTPPGGPMEARASALSLLSDFLLARAGSLKEPRKSFLEGCCYSLPRMAISACGAGLNSFTKCQAPTCSHLLTKYSEHFTVPTEHMRQARTREVGILPKATQQRRLTPDPVAHLVLPVEPDSLTAATSCCGLLLPTGQRE